MKEKNTGLLGHVKCPECGQIVVMNFKKGVFSSGYVDTECPNPRCRRLISAERARDQQLFCPKCNSLRSVDLLESDGRCPIHHDEMVFLNQRQAVSCPKCGGSNYIDPDYEKTCTCKWCRNLFIIKDAVEKANKVEEVAKVQVINSAGMENVTSSMVWKYPQRTFAADTILDVPQNLVALVYYQNAEHPFQFRGCHKPLGALLNTQDEEIVADIYYLTIRANGRVFWGIRLGTMTLEDSTYRCDCSNFSPTGSITVNVVSPEKFMQWVNMTECTEPELGIINAHDVNAKVLSSGNDLHSLLVSEMPTWFKNCCDALVQSRGIHLYDLSTYKNELRESLRVKIDNELSAFGLAVTGIEVNMQNITTNDLTVQNNMNVLARLNSEIYWNVPSVQVGLYGKPNVTVTFDISGTAKVRVINEKALRAHSDYRDWELSQDNLVATKSIGRYLSGELNSQLPLILRHTVNDNQIAHDLRELQLYTKLFSNKLIASLNIPNSYLDMHGLEIDTLSVTMNCIRESELHKRVREVDEHAVSVQLDQQKKDIDRNAEAQDAEKQALHNDTLNRTKVNTVQSDISAQIAIETARAQQDKARADLQHQKELDALRRENELKQAQIQLSTETQRRAFELWREEHARDEEMLNAQARYNLMQLHHDQAYEAAERAAGYTEEVDQAKHQQLMTDIMLSIEQSKLSFQEKLDAYARLKVIEDANAQGEATRSEARANADELSILEGAKLKLSDEAAVLMNKAQALADAREERKLAAAFSRDMEIRRFNVLHEMEKLRLQHSLQQAQLEMQMRRSHAEDELAKIKLFLEYALGDSQLQASKAQADVALEHLRQKAEKEYEERKAEKEAAKQSAERQEQERLSREAAERARELMKQFRECQESLKEMQRSHASESQCGASMAQTNGVKQMQDSQMQDLVGAMQQIAESMGKPMAPAAAPAQPETETDKLDWLVNAVKKLINNASSANQGQPAPSARGGYVEPGAPESQSCPRCGCRMVGNRCLFCGYDPSHN